MIAGIFEILCIRSGKLCNGRNEQKPCGKDDDPGNRLLAYELAYEIKMNDDAR